MSQDILNILKNAFPSAIVEQETETGDYLEIKPGEWFEIATFLHDTPELHFDSLQCITGVDWGPEAHLEVRYNLHSMKHKHKLEIRIVLDRETPEVPSVEKIWRVADWFEREVYDMYGIVFTGHRDLRRILLPDDWIGWPLRKDYETPETYHGIVVPKIKEEWE